MAVTNITVMNYDRLRINPFASIYQHPSRQLLRHRLMLFCHKHHPPKIGGPAVDDAQQI